MKQKALRAGDAHSHEDEECRKRLRSARECAKAHSFSFSVLTSLKTSFKIRMKRKLILMAIIAFSGFSIEANAAVNDEALSNVQNKMIEYINNYSFSNNADESATEGTTNNTVDFNWSDYVNNAGNVYKDAVEQIVSELPEITVPETSVQSPETSEAPDISVTPDITEDSGSINEDVLIQPFVIDNILRIVHVGESYTINVLHSPGEVVFTSSNPEVATVDGNGNVVAISTW